MRTCQSYDDQLLSVLQPICGKKTFTFEFSSNPFDQDFFLILQALNLRSALVIDVSRSDDDPISRSRLHLNVHKQNNSYHPCAVMVIS